LRRMNIEECIRSRRSMRRYAKKSPDKAEMDAVRALVRGAERLDPAIPLRFEIVDSPDSVGRLMRGMLGSYGKIDSPACLAAVTRDLPGCLENIGYAGERIVLGLASRGVSTCWVGGTFDRGAAKELLGVKPPDSLVCLIAFGYGDERRKDPLRTLAGSNRKKGAEKLFFNGTWGVALSLAGEPFPGAFAAAELCALAPSAMNTQPVRCVLSGREAAIYAQKARGPAPLDAGIMMAHLALALELQGKRPAWKGPSSGASAIDAPSSYRYLGKFVF
jgi:nitroreductase